MGREGKKGGRDMQCLADLTTDLVYLKDNREDNGERYIRIPGYFTLTFWAER